MDKQARDDTTQVQSGHSDELMTIRQCDWSRAGYAFKHWNTMPNGSGTTYLPGQSHSFQQDLSLYAIWEPAVALLDMSQIRSTLTGSKQGENSNSSPLYAWVYGRPYINYSRNKYDAEWTTGNHNVLLEFDCTSPLVGSRTITITPSLYGGEGQTSTTTAGCGGTCVKTLTFDSNERVLVTKVSVCPYIGCFVAGTSYWSGQNYNLVGQGWWWSATSDMPLPWATQSSSWVYNRGQWFQVQMTVKCPNGETRTFAVTKQDPDATNVWGWARYSSTQHVNHSLELPILGQDDLDSLEGCYTQSIEFRQFMQNPKSTSSATGYNMAVHGMQFHGIRFAT